VLRLVVLLLLVLLLLLLLLHTRSSLHLLVEVGLLKVRRLG
jgi:hypothetical protein